MASKMNQCRFCLKNMAVNERMALIDEEIQDQFSSITQLQLLLGDGYSQIICELCLRSLQLASAVKLQFIENQRKLHCFNNFENESNHSESPIIQPPTQKRRRKESKPMRNHEEFVDPLQLVSVHDEESSPENRSPEVKQERHDEFESFNYEEEPNLLEEISTSRNSRDERKPKSLSTSFNVPKPERISIKKDLGNRNFQCPHCKNYYKRKPHMLRHIEVAHMKVKYICVVPNCSLFFVRKERLKKHLEVNHADLTPLEMTYMIEKLRTMKPVYGNEAPEVNDDSQNVEDSMRQDEQDGEAGSSRDFNGENSRVYDENKGHDSTSREYNQAPKVFNTEQDTVERESSLFRGLQLRYAPDLQRINTSGLRDFASEVRENDNSINQTI